MARVRPLAPSRLCNKRLARGVTERPLDRFRLLGARRTPGQPAEHGRARAPQAALEAADGRPVDAAAAGRQRSESFDRQVDAARFKATAEADLLRGGFIDPDAGKITLRRYATEIWLPAQTFGPSTRETVERQVRLHILPDLGDTKGLGRYRLAELARSPSVIQAWIRGLQTMAEKPLAPSHIKLVLTTLSMILSAAMADERITRNPVKVRTVVKPPKPEQRKLVPWEAARVAGIRAVLPYRYQALCDAGSGAGLRQGEVFGLSPDDIDWLRKIIHPRRQVRSSAAGACSPRRKAARSAMSRWPASARSGCLLIWLPSPPRRSRCPCISPAAGSSRRAWCSPRKTRARSGGATSTATCGIRH